MLGNKRTLAVVLVALLMIGLLSGCSKPAEPGEASAEKPAAGGKVSIRAAAGGVGGGWYTVLAGLAEIVAENESSVSVQVVPGGGLLNPPRIGTKEIEMAFVFPPFLNTAMEGKEPFDKAYPDVRGVIKGFGEAVGQFVVAESTGLVSFKDIADKKYPLKIAVDRVGTTDEWLFRNILAFYNVTYEDIAKWGGKVTHAGYNDQATLFKDRHVDALFGNIAIPWTAAMEAQLARKIKLMPFDDDLRNHLIENFAFSPGEIPAGTYGIVEQPIPTVASITTLAAHKDVSEDVVYKITKAICGNPDRVKATHDSAKSFDPEKAHEGLGAPLHPGAEKYFKEVGLIK